MAAADARVDAPAGPRQGSAGSSHAGAILWGLLLGAREREGEGERQGQGAMVSRRCESHW